LAAPGCRTLALPALALPTVTRPALARPALAWRAGPGLACFALAARPAAALVAAFFTAAVPLVVLVLLATVPPAFVRSLADLGITSGRTLSRTTVKTKHLFDRVACCCGNCRSRAVDIAQTFDRTLVRRTGREEPHMSSHPLHRPDAPFGTGARLTRRGRTALLLILVGLLLGAFSLGRVGSQAATPSPDRPSLQQTTVHAGESLWSVAHRIAPSADPRDVVLQLRRLNHLDDSGVQVGQQLVLPRSA